MSRRKRDVLSKHQRRTQHGRLFYTAGGTQSGVLFNTAGGGANRLTLRYSRRGRKKVDSSIQQEGCKQVDSPIKQEATQTCSVFNTEGAVYYSPLLVYATESVIAFRDPTQNLNTI